MELGAGITSPTTDDATHPIKTGGANFRPNVVPQEINCGDGAILTTNFQFLEGDSNLQEATLDLIPEFSQPFYGNGLPHLQISGTNFASFYTLFGEDQCVNNSAGGMTWNFDGDVFNQALFPPPANPPPGIRAPSGDTGFDASLSGTIDGNTGEFSGTVTFTEDSSGNTITYGITGQTVATIIDVEFADPDNGDSVFSNGDTATLTFNLDTNQPSISSISDFESNFSVHDSNFNIFNPGSAISGTWSDARTLVLTFSDTSGNTLPTNTGDIVFAFDFSNSAIDPVGTTAGVDSDFSPAARGSFGELPLIPECASSSLLFSDLNVSTDCTISSDTIVNGDVTIDAAAAEIISGITLTINGDLIILNDGSLTIKNGGTMIIDIPTKIPL